MPIAVNLLQLGNGILRLQGELPAEELDLDDVDELIHPKLPLNYDVSVEKEPGGLLARGKLRIVLDCECSRCLSPFLVTVENLDWTCMLAFEGEDKVTVISDSVDLTPQIREDIVLAFPQHPLCKTNCQGLKPLRSEPSGGIGSKGGATSSSTPWSALDNLEI